MKLPNMIRKDNVLFVLQHGEYIEDRTFPSNSQAKRAVREGKLAVREFYSACNEFGEKTLRSKFISPLPPDRCIIDTRVSREKRPPKVSVKRRKQRESSSLQS